MKYVQSLQENLRNLKLWLVIGLLLCICPAYGSHPIEKHDENAVRAVLMEEVPGLIINKITLITAGYDHLVADVNNEWIFRFPLLEEYIPVIEREILLLHHVEDNVSMAIPHYQYVGTNTAFVGYRKIMGEQLIRENYCKLSDDCRQDIAESLALFITQLHKCVEVNKALEWGYKEHRLPLQWIEHDLIDTLSSKEIAGLIKEALLYAKQHPCHVDNVVFLHNDLHGENLIFDVNSGQLVGVIDFSDAAIGEYSVEFGKFFSVHHDLAFRTAEAYARLNHLPNPIIPAAVDLILRRATYILVARESCNSSREIQLLQMLQNFIPIWDQLIKIYQ